MGTGKCRVATEEGKNTCWSNFPWFVLRTPPHPLYAFLAGRMKRLAQQTPAVALLQGGQGVSFVFTAIFTTFERCRHLMSAWHKIPSPQAWEGVA